MINLNPNHHVGCENCGHVGTTMEIDVVTGSNYNPSALDLCSECLKDMAFKISNEVYQKETTPSVIFYCDTNKCGRFIVTDKTRTCGCGQEYKLTTTELGITVDKVMA